MGWFHFYPSIIWYSGREKIDRFRDRLEVNRACIQRLSDLKMQTHVQETENSSANPKVLLDFSVSALCQRQLSLKFISEKFISELKSLDLKSRSRVHVLNYTSVPRNKLRKNKSGSEKYAIIRCREH